MSNILMQFLTLLHIIKNAGVFVFPIIKDSNLKKENIMFLLIAN